MQHLFFALLLLATYPQEPNEAEKRFRLFEKKLAAASVIQFTFETKVEGLPESGQFRGAFTLAKGNKLRINMTVEMKDKNDNWNIVSDGTKYKDPEIARATPARLYDKFLSSVRHAGPISGIYLSEGDEKEERWPMFSASDFKLGETEKIGTRQAVAVSCKLAEPAKKGVVFSETLWLDVETNLPLKRVFTGNLDKMEFTFTETYANLVLDPKIDAKLFELLK